MRASKGDQIVVPGEHVGQPERHGEIVEVRGEGGAPPYLVRWSDTEQEHLFFPAPDTTIEARPR
jgi:hypothetical protein